MPPTPDAIERRAEEIKAKFPRGVLGWLHISEPVQVKWLAFIGASCAVLAQAPPFSDEVRYGAAALAAGCAAVVALSRAPGQPKPPEGGQSRG